MSYYNNKKSVGRIIANILCGVLCIAAVAGAGTALYMGGKNNGWFQKDEPNIEEDLNGGAIIEETAGVSMKLMSAKIMAADYEEYGVSAQAETAYTLTATIYPEDATNKLVDWSVAFADASSTWASGKTVTNYVTVTPSSDGALTAVVENIAAFGEQIVVTVTSRDNPSAYASATVEYLQRTTGYTFNLDGKTYSTNGTTSNTVTPTFATTKSASASITVNKSTVYTKTNTDSATYFTIKPTETLKTAVTNAGLTSSALKEYSGNASATLTNFFDSAWGSALYSTNAQKNALISALESFNGNAYEIAVYASQGGTRVATFYITFDTSTIDGQKGVESVIIDKTEIVF